MRSYRKDDYVTIVKKPKRCKQSILPREKKPKDYNGSKSTPGKHEVKFQRAKDLK